MGPVTRVIVNFVIHDYIAVDIFFVLSGFLITALLLRDQDAPHFFHNFYMRRALRILPVFLVALLLFWHWFPNSGSYILICLLLVGNFSSRFGIPITSPIWTLCIEEQFYFFWPQALRRCTPKTIGWIAFSLAVFSMALRPLMMVFHGGMSIQNTYYRLDGLGLGSLAGCVYMAKEELGPGLTRVLEVLKSQTLLCIAVAAFLLTPLLSSYRYQMPLSISLTTFLGFRFILAVVNGWTSRFLASRVLGFFATISYGMYMYNAFVSYYIATHYGAPNMTHPWTLVLRTVLILGVTTVVSTLSLYLLEKPAQRLRRYVLYGPANVHEAMVTQVHPVST